MKEKCPKKKLKKENKDIFDPRNNLKTRHDEIADVYSYVHTLPPEAKEWMERFVQEEIRANLTHPGEKINDTSNPAVRSRIYNRNNERNRCIMTREHAQGTMNYLEDLDLDNENSVDDGYD